MTLDVKDNLPLSYDFTDCSSISLYIHFPFCIEQCSFCPIKTIKYDSNFAYNYIQSLKNEITACMNNTDVNRIKVDAVHFGGGTPSLIKASQLNDILNTIGQFVNIDTSEIIIEMHPQFISTDLLTYLGGLRNCTANLGIQSFDDSILTSMNRHYSCLDMLHMVELIQKNVTSLGIDYICGWHTADFKTLETDLKYIDLIHPEHISQYPLYPKSSQNNNIYMNQSEECVNKKVALNFACEQYLSSMGYNRYSIFHYENRKKISHLYGRNQLTGGKWIGFGADAYTYLGNLIRLNSNIKDYISGRFIYKQNKLDCRERCLWEFLFFIRTVPLSKETITIRYGSINLNLIDVITQELQRHHYINSQNDMSLTWNGIINLDKVERIISDVFSKNASSIL